MILKLSVKNFVIIEDVEIDFKSGMSVITGETGAGKSLIIDTINLLLGERADTEMIRDGNDFALITGIFTNDSNILELLNKYNIKSDDILTIERIISKTKNIIKINNTVITLQILKHFSKYLADIHIQNDTMKLFNPDTYIDFLDPKNDLKFDKLINDYTKLLYDYKDSLKTYNLALKGQKETIEKLEFLEYTKKELDALDLEEGIDIKLEEEIKKLENFDKISSNLKEAYNNLESDNFSSLDNIYDSAKCLEKISSYDDKYADFNEKLLDIYYIGTEIKDLISKELNSLDYDDEELNIKVERLNEINKVKDKYKMNLSELIEHNKKISLEISMVNNYDEILEEKKNECISSFNKVVLAAKKIHDYRLKLATSMEKAIIKECIDLDLSNTSFNIELKENDISNPFNDSIFLNNGIDVCDFLISFNKGESKRSLHKVASGGEASRIMLAFKSFFAEKSEVSLMIFDEIDSGVSGITAKKISDKMYEISKKLQVICITHLPQVAARGDNHIFIYKEENNNRTFTKVKELNKDERIEEIATMLSGDRLSVYALEHAKELLNE